MNKLSRKEIVLIKIINTKKVNMVGKIIKNIRTSKGINLTELSKLAKIDVGYLSHIEKGDRTPSHKTLKNICNALEVPYSTLMNSYDQTLSDNFEEYGLLNYIPYNKVLAFDSIPQVIDIPPHIKNSSLAIKMPDNSMEKTINTGDYIHIEFINNLQNNDIGIFSLNNKILIRRFILENGEIILKADNKKFEDICIKNDISSFYIIGKINF